MRNQGEISELNLIHLPLSTDCTQVTPPPFCLVNVYNDTIKALNVVR